MKFEKSSQELVERFRRVAPGGPEAEERKMFGYPAGFVHGNMFMGLMEERFVVRLGPGEREAALAEGAVPFEVNGRTMREYVALPASVVGDDAALAAWVAKAYAYGYSLPQKAPRSRRPAKVARPEPGRAGR